MERDACGLSQAVLAEKVGLSRDAIAKYEIDKQLPTVENLLKLAQFFEKPMEYFLTGNYPIHQAKEFAIAADVLSRAAREMARLAGIGSETSGNGNILQLSKPQAPPKSAPRSKSKEKPFLFHAALDDGPVDDVEGPAKDLLADQNEEGEEDGED